MAKQTGLHQIRGKVGEHSYYRQSGVSSGLIRGINPGMSSRVKNSPEYANTRLNNKEFKTASRLAASMIDGIVPRMSPMFNTFKNAKLSASLLELIKSKTGAWGNRFLAMSDRAAACVAANKLAKNNYGSYIGVSFGAFDSETNLQTIDVDASLPFADILQSLGATGASVTAYQVQIYEGMPTEDESARLDNVVVRVASSDDTIAASELPQAISLDVTHQDVSLTLINGRAYLSFYVVVILPFRTVGGTNHILQEGCTFAYFADPEQAQ